MLDAKELKHLRAQWRRLAALIGPGRKPSNDEVLYLYKAWQDGWYDPTTGVYDNAARRRATS